MSEDPGIRGESLEEIATFLSTDVEAFRTVGGDQLARLAAAVTHRELAAGETMIVEGGHPSTQLWVLRDGALDLLRRDHLVTVMTSGELLGYASLLTRLPYSFGRRSSMTLASTHQMSSRSPKKRYFPSGETYAPPAIGSKPCRVRSIGSPHDPSAFRKLTKR